MKEMQRRDEEFLLVRPDNLQIARLGEGGGHGFSAVEPDFTDAVVIPAIAKRRFRAQCRGRMVLHIFADMPHEFGDAAHERGVLVQPVGAERLP
jgi:hypothetical protein